MQNTVANQTGAPSVLANERGQANMLSLMMNVDFMANIDKMAELMANGSATVPQHLKGNKADCFAICLQAIQWGMNPFPVAQKTHLVGSTLGYEAQLINAVVVNSGVIKGRFKYKWLGDWEKILGNIQEEKDPKNQNKKIRKPGWTILDEKDCGVTITATLADGTQTELTLYLSQAGTRNSSLWVDDPKQQLSYLAVKRWTRLYTPDVILGVYSIDELEEREINPDFTPSDNEAGSSGSATNTLAAKAAAKRAEQQAAKGKGAVIEGEAEIVVSDEPTTNDAPAAEPAIDLEAQDLLCDTLFKMDNSQSASEIKTLVGEIVALKERLTDEQRNMANEVYKRNIERLDLRKKADA
ncbi:RecT family recombinase [Aeromonas enteropelogenes]|uniref:RecT family recombinase n=1 Tax=Aeromonas enteropelogenes TaxID=29489 RepID=UPI003BA39CBD